MLDNLNVPSDNENVMYLGNVGLTKDQVQGIVAQYLGQNNEELKDVISQAEQEEQDVRFKAIWLTDANFCEIHFTAVQEKTDTDDDTSTTTEVTEE